MVWELGEEILARHIDVGRVTQRFGEQYQVDQFARLEHIAKVEVPMNIGAGGNLVRAQAGVREP